MQFWQVVDGRGQTLSASFPHKGLVEKLNEAKRDGISRYYMTRDGYKMLALGVTTAPRSHVALYRSRYVNLPGKDVAGDVVDLGLGAGEGLAEGTHFVFFPNNIMGALYNFQGPTTNRFAAYLRYKFGLDISFAPIYRRDVAQILVDLEKVSKIEVAIPANQAHLFAAPTDGDDGFAQSLFHGARVLGGGNLRLELSVGQGAPTSRYEELKEFARRLARRDDLHAFRVAKVYGRREGEKENQPIDLLTEQLITRKDVEPEAPATTKISQSSASAAVSAAYKENRGQITLVTETMPDLTRSFPISTINPSESHDNDTS